MVTPATVLRYKIVSGSTPAHMLQAATIYHAEQPTRKTQAQRPRLFMVASNQAIWQMLAAGLPKGFSLAKVSMR